MDEVVTRAVLLCCGIVAEANGLAEVEDWKIDPKSQLVVLWQKPEPKPANTPLVVVGAGAGAGMLKLMPPTPDRMLTPLTGSDKATVFDTQACAADVAADVEDNDVLLEDIKDEDEGNEPNTNGMFVVVKLGSGMLENGLTGGFDCVASDAKLVMDPNENSGIGFAVVLLEDALTAEIDVLSSFRRLDCLIESASTSFCSQSRWRDGETERSQTDNRALASNNDDSILASATRLEG